MDLIIMGIESTAHTFGVGIVRSKPFKILADIRRQYKPKEGGILPREVASYFSSVAAETIRDALNVSGLYISDVDAIAIALGPGLGPSLRVGATVARALAHRYNKPLIPVNHAVAHIEIARTLTELRDPLVLYVSGGNTIVTTFNKGKYRVFGETQDIALGNLLDTFAREVGIAPPYVINGKHAIDICAEGGEFLEDELPYTVKGQDVSFSGLLTASLRAVRKGRKLEDVCFTLREIAYSSVVEVTERGLAHTGKRALTVTGGVAASEELRKKLSLMAKEHNIEFKPVPKEYAGDNGVMIAVTGLLAYINNIRVDVGRSYVRQRWRLDEVEIPWYPLLPQDI
jgi:N6-L-threonylcarbamoyladenine synthase